MKSRIITVLLLIGMLCGGVAEAARRPSKAGSVKQAYPTLDALFNAIEMADIVEVERLLQDEATREVINEHNGKFSPLGKVNYELEQNKTCSLIKPEKMARTKRLNKIKRMLQESGAILIYSQAQARNNEPLVDRGEESVMLVK